MPVIKKSSQPQIIHAIVGTAGHVDHGKTSLVRLLTGCETDRLPEEQARGMSIDLGFAPCILSDDGSENGPNRRIVGIVDVPGHRDFIRNMVAGAASIDVLLLVIAADDGIMPQTLEHMTIVRLLRKPQVLVALTKIDMVSPERLEQVRQEITAFLARTGFTDSPIINVSNKTGEGIGEIRETIDAFVDSVRDNPSRDREGATCTIPEPHGRSLTVASQKLRLEDRAFRMNIERVFSVKGYGTVVTGIPLSGAAHIGDKVELLPARRELIVRTVQTYKMQSDVALARTCCAINVRDIDADKVARGMTLAAPGIYQPTTELIVLLENVSEAGEGGGIHFKRRFDARLHSGTGSVGASIKLIDADELAPGCQAPAHVVLDDPLVLAAGDRFILRSLSPAATLGGGAVLSARPQRLRRHTDHAPRLAAATEALQRNDFFAAELLAGPNVILSAAQASHLAQYTGDLAKKTIETAIANGVLADLSDGYAIPPRIDELRAILIKSLERYHRSEPYAFGMPPGLVCTIAGISPRGFDRFAALLAQTGPPPLITTRHGRLALASFKPNISERLLTLRGKILTLVEQSGLNAPARGNLMRDLVISEPDMKILEKILRSDNSIILLDGNFMLRSAFDAARQKLLELFQKTPNVDLGAFRDAVGCSRKMTVAMLDAFDAEGLTRRLGTGRVLVRPPAP